MMGDGTVDGLIDDLYMQSVPCSSWFESQWHHCQPSKWCSMKSILTCSGLQS